jgi:hypothetical protein
VVSTYAILLAAPSPVFRRDGTECHYPFISSLAATILEWHALSST